MTTLANHAQRGKAATRQANSELCVIVGWRRIKGAWRDIHEVVANGTILVRDINGFRVMHSESVEQGAYS